MRSADEDGVDDHIVNELAFQLDALESTRALPTEIGAAERLLLRVYGADPDDLPNATERRRLAAQSIVLMTSVITMLALVLIVLATLPVPTFVALASGVAGCAAVGLMFATDRIPGQRLDDDFGPEAQRLVTRPAAPVDAETVATARRQVQSAINPSGARRTHSLGGLRVLVSLVAAVLMSYLLCVALLTQGATAVTEAPGTRAQALRQIDRVGSELSRVRSARARADGVLADRIAVLRRQTRAAGYQPAVGCPSPPVDTQCPTLVASLDSAKRLLASPPSDSLAGRRIREERKLRSRLARARAAYRRAGSEGAVSVGTRSFADRAESLNDDLTGDPQVAVIFLMLIFGMASLTLTSAIVRRGRVSDYELRRDLRALVLRLIDARREFLASQPRSVAIGSGRRDST